MFKLSQIYAIARFKNCLLFDQESDRVENMTLSAQGVFDELRCVSNLWKCGETLSQVFDLSSKSKLKLRRKQRNKIVKIYASYPRTVTVTIGGLL